MMSFLIFLHFVLATFIIFFVIVQRSAETSILVSSNHFSPGVANKLLVKITRTLVALFILNCLAISYLKYHSGHNIGNMDDFIKTQQTTTENKPSVPTN